MTDQARRFYVYEWFIVDTLEVFYVGKGTGRRRFELHNRNRYFNAVYRKYRCEVRIVEQSLTNPEACELEKERIAGLKLIGQAKCNFTNGGTGFSEGYLNPNALNPPKGAKNPMYGVRRVGEDNHFFGRQHTDATKRKISMHRKGKGARFGADNPMYGKGQFGEDNPMYGRTGLLHHNSHPYRITFLDGRQIELHAKGCEEMFGIAFVRVKETGGRLHYRKACPNAIYEGTLVEVI